MTDLFKFHHLGLATDNIEETRAFLMKLGFTSGEIIHVPVQRVKVCFMTKPDHPQVELITSAEKGSPVDNILAKCGSGLYHFCYQVNDMNQAINFLKAEKFIMLNKPVKSNAIDGNIIIFAYKKSFGLVEIVEIAGNDR